MSEEGKWGMVIKMMVMQRTRQALCSVWEQLGTDQVPSPIIHHKSQLTLIEIKLNN